MQFYRGVSVLKVLLVVSIHGAMCGSPVALENGYYTGIVVAIDGNKISMSECSDLVDNLKIIINEFSSKLYEATGGRAGIGVVNILIPQEWGLCGVHQVNSTEHYSYQTAAFQLTKNHPLANSLPWTRQYRPCGQEADSVILPFSFISGGDFTDSIKGQLLLHEWIKFRYGAFDEMGYDADASLAPCYTQYNLAHFTTCSSERLPAVAADESACSLNFIMDHEDHLQLQHQISHGSTSVMSSPYIESIFHMCNASNHNPWARTKQNAYCSRRSVRDVVFSHSDFLNVSPSASLRQGISPVVNVVKHGRNYRNFAFVIEDSEEMRKEHKILHVKQAIAQFLQIQRIDTGTMVLVELFAVNSINSTYQVITSDDLKQKLLTCIPDVINTKTGNVRVLTPAIEYLMSNLPDSNAWEVVFFTGTPNVTDMSAAMSKFVGTPHSVSVLTFDSTSDWLLWNSIPNTKVVSVLPLCSSSVPCSLQTSAFIMNHLVGLLNDQHYNPRFIQIADQQPLTMTSTPLQLTPAENNVKELYLFITFSQGIATPANRVELVAPDGIKCTATQLLNYGFVVTFTEVCSYKQGEWMVRLTSPGSGAVPQIYAFLEYKDAVLADRPLVKSSFGILDPTQGISPNSNLTSAYVAVTTSDGRPVLNAQVSLTIFHTKSLSPGGQRTTIFLHDNGDTNNGVDQTENDGVYSTILWGYSTTPSFHLVEVEVNTDGSSPLQTIQPPNAVVFDDKMKGKCCGKRIIPLDPQLQLVPMKFRLLANSFKTVQSFDELRLPPGQVDSFRTDETKETLTIEFMAVQGDVSDDTVKVQGYHACCVPTSTTNQSNTVPSDSDCQPGTVDCSTISNPNQVQKCTLNKATLVGKFLASKDKNNFNGLICGVRAVNTNSVMGSISTGHFGVDVIAAMQNTQGGGEPECKKISDGCLPITIFWIMIGCLALLLVLMVVLLICWWCCTARKGNKSSTPKKKEEKVLSVYYDRNNTDPRVLPDPPSPEEPKVVNDIFVNNAYIQDGDGHIKIIADNGQIMNKASNTPATNHYERGQQERVVTIPIQTVPATPVAPMREASVSNMQVYKPVAPPRPNTLRTRPTPNEKPGREKPTIVHANPMLRSDSSFGPTAYQTFQSPTSPVHHIISPSPIRTNPGTVYATIGRTGRLKSTSPGTPPEIIPPAFGTMPRNKNMDSHYMVPITQKGVKPPPITRRRDPIPDPPPPQLQSYPSTDSDSTVNAPPGVRRNQHYPGRPKYNHPPPYPIGSQMVSNRFGGGRGGGDDVAIIEARSPTPNSVVIPPVAPPRFDLGTQQRGPVQTFASKQDLSSDEDSDQWDDGEQFEFTTGVSYA